MELIALAVLLWRIPSAWPVVALVAYAAVATLRWSLWKVSLVVVEPHEHHVIFAQEYYGVLFPLGILIASARGHPIDWAVLAAHLLAFPAPALLFARQAQELLRDLVQSWRYSRA